MSAAEVHECITQAEDDECMAEEVSFDWVISYDGSGPSNSPEFAGGFTLGAPGIWCLEVNQNEEVDSNPYISASLVLLKTLRNEELSPNTSYTLILGITCTTNNGISFQKRSSVLEFKTNGECCWGWTDFISKKELEKYQGPEKVQSLRFETTILLINAESQGISQDEVLVSKSSGEPMSKRPRRMQVYEKVSVKKGETFWKRVNGSSIKHPPKFIRLHVEEHQFRVHTEILKEKSVYFKKMLEKEEMEILGMNGVSKRRVEGLLDYVYNGFTTDLEEDAFDLLKLAQEYGILSLMNECLVELSSRVESNLDLLPQVMLIAFKDLEGICHHVRGFFTSLFKRQIKTIRGLKSFKELCQDEQNKRIFSQVLFGYLET